MSAMALAARPVSSCPAAGAAAGVSRDGRDAGGYRHQPGGVPAGQGAQVAADEPGLRRAGGAAYLKRPGACGRARGLDRVPGCLSGPGEAGPGYHDHGRPAARPTAETSSSQACAAGPHPARPEDHPTPNGSARPCRVLSGQRSRAAPRGHRRTDTPRPEDQPAPRSAAAPAVAPTARPPAPGAARRTHARRPPARRCYRAGAGSPSPPGSHRRRTRARAAAPPARATAGCPSSGRSRPDRARCRPPARPPGRAPRPASLRPAWPLPSRPLLSTAWSAPHRSANSRFASSPATAIVRSPSAFPSWTAAVPTPPAAPCTSSVSPACARARRTSANRPVR